MPASSEALWNESDWVDRPEGPAARSTRGIWTPIVARLKENPGKSRLFKDVSKSQANYLRKHHGVQATNVTVLQDDGTKRVDMFVWYEPEEVEDVKGTAAEPDEEPTMPAPFETEDDEDEPSRADRVFQDGDEWSTGSAEGLGIHG